VSYDNPPPPPPPQYGAPVPGANAGSNKKAIWSLVLGIIGVICCGIGIIPGGIAIFLGRGAKQEIAASGQTGGGMAQAGIILGIIAVVLSILYYILLAMGSIDYNFSTN
jgi:hypothetical protein